MTKTKPTLAGKKPWKRFFAVAAMLALATLATLLAVGCAQPATQSQKSVPNATGSSNSDVPSNSILAYRADDEKCQKLIADMEAGRTPVSCDVLYDQSGSLPPVLAEDAKTITELFERFSKMIVLDSTNESITDSYHYVVFTLQDGSRVGFDFEGDVWLLDNSNDRCKVQDTADFWSYVRDLQKEKASTGPLLGEGR